MSGKCLKEDELNSGMSEFVFVTCQSGAEKTLKAEVAKKYPDFKFAYSRPGFLTFRAPRQLEANFELALFFARSYGLSFNALPAETTAQDLERIVKYSGADVVHHWSRLERHPEPIEYDVETPVRRDGEPVALKLTPPEACLGLWNKEALKGQKVLDFIETEADQVWVGLHVQSASHSPFRGGLTPIDLPEKAPSRAYLKAREMALFSERWGSGLKAGDTIVEIGSAPGGAAYAFLEMGLNYVGIDPGAMDPVLYETHKGSNRYKNLALRAHEVQDEDLPPTVDWIALDINAEARVGLKVLSQVLSLRGGLLHGFPKKGFLLTFKINRWEHAAEADDWFGILKSFGITRLRAAQLSFHHQEVGMVGGLAKRTKI